jgi:uncharacterized protein
MSAKQFVSGLFELWEQGNAEPFFAALAPDLTWTVSGSTPISGTFHGKSAYLEQVYKPLLSIFTGPTVCRVRRILGDGDSVVVEWHGDTPTRSGRVYSQDYCWLIRVGTDGRTIQEVAGYFDTERVSELFAAMR